mmetsp:Transcript_10803/g.16592  ORF Transcript_10803/g.16592 Transcript_10803/m.16592 type:complete len:255 (-) Transcript_10803:206-970(-)
MTFIRSVRTNLAVCAPLMNVPTTSRAAILVFVTNASVNVFLRNAGSNGMQLGGIDALTVTCKQDLQSAAHWSTVTTAATHNVFPLRIVQIAALDRKHGIVQYFIRISNDRIRFVSTAQHTFRTLVGIDAWFAIGTFHKSIVALLALARVVGPSRDTAIEGTHFRIQFSIIRRLLNLLTRQFGDRSRTVCPKAFCGGIDYSLGTAIGKAALLSTTWITGICSGRDINLTMNDNNLHEGNYQCTKTQHNSHLASSL